MAPALLQRAAALVLIVVLSACGTTSRRDAPIPPTMEKDPKTGGYYLDDGPGDNPPADLDRIPDAVPRLEPLHRGASRPYSVMGRDYMPMTTLARYKARGTATWYGRRYHGKPTSSGEIYDMYAMTGAHTTLPIPSYARVTNLANGKSVVVRINDRGPFIGERLIDVSYAAAYKLGLVGKGSALVEVESVLPGDPAPAMSAAAAPSPSPPSPPETASAVAPSQDAPRAVPLASPDNSPAQATGAPQVNEAAGSGPAKVETAAPLSKGIYVQFGAFRLRENAESYLARLRLRIEWLAARLHVVPRGGLYRVHAGPYASAIEARDIANRAGDPLGLKPILLAH